MEERLTEKQCLELFQHLFPNGLDDPSLVQRLAPEGWEHSPLALVYHPTVEQRYEEALRLRENLRRLRPSPVSEEEPRITLDTIRQEMPVEASNPREECADLMGCCLWDIFSDNHEVRTADALIDLGTFRAAAGFIADVRHGLANSGAEFSTRGNYLEFYMGTSMVRHRTDLTPVYELIFRRMHRLGLDWQYVHPRLMAVDLRPLQETSESEQVSEAVQYNPHGELLARTKRSGARRRVGRAPEKLGRCLPGISGRSQKRTASSHGASISAGIPPVSHRMAPSSRERER